MVSKLKAINGNYWWFLTIKCKLTSIRVTSFWVLLKLSTFIEQKHYLKFLLKRAIKVVKNWCKYWLINEKWAPMRIPWYKHKKLYFHTQKKQTPSFYYFQRQSSKIRSYQKHLETYFMVNLIFNILKEYMI